jgi:hypothetical protein
MAFNFYGCRLGVVHGTVASATEQAKSVIEEVVETLSHSGDVGGYLQVVDAFIYAHT